MEKRIATFRLWRTLVNGKRELFKLKKTKDIHRCDLKRAIIRCMDANMFSANMFAIDR